MCNQKWIFFPSNAQLLQPEDSEFYRLSGVFHLAALTMHHSGGTCQLSDKAINLFDLKKNNVQI